MKEKIDGIEFERSTGNVFADLGLPRPEDRLIKSNLTALITKEISQRNLTQSEVGELVGLDQADVSRLLRGRVNRFSVERLFEILNRLGYTVELRITHEDRARHAANTFVNVSR
jgi:predicted XRE-type DNA-binding protein